MMQAARARHSAEVLQWPVRAFVEPAVIKTHLALDELCLAVLKLECVVILADQEQAALAGVQVRVHAIEHVLIDDEGTYSRCTRQIISDVDRIDRGVATQGRVIGVVLGKLYAAVRKWASGAAAWCCCVAE